MPKTSINMHHFRFLGIAFTLLSSLFLASCQDHIPAPPTPARFRLTNYAYRQQSFSYSLNFRYDPSGKVTSYLETNYGVQTTVTLAYNEKGQLIRLDRIPTDGNPITPGSYNSYEYDQAGNLVKRTRYVTKNGYSSSGNTYIKVEETTYEYDASSLYPSRVFQNLFDLDGNVIVRYREDRTYQNGNVIRSVNTNLTDSKVAQTTFDFQFDDKPNPFYNFVGLSEGTSIYPFNRNNVISAVSELRYDGNGYVTRMVLNDNADPASRTIKEYTYEPY